MSTTAQAPACEFCGAPLDDLGESYYDHLRTSKRCEAAWQAWLDNLVLDHPGGD